MPNHGNPSDVTDGEPTHDKDAPDLVGEELGDGAHIWRVYDRVARNEDRERVGNWNRGLDNLALFAGLFSAVTTAFIIELQKDTKPDYARLTFFVLNATASGVSFKEEPFLIDPTVRLTNCLWIASLMLSLSAALIAIMGKDWIGMYASRPTCNPRQWADIRTYRLACVERWYMSGVIASAPVLLHLSLLLFGAGLVLFVSSDRFSQRLALALCLAAGGLYVIIFLSAILFPTSPFKSPATQAVRGSFLSMLASLRDRLAYPPQAQPVALLQQATLIISAVLSHPMPAMIIPLDRAQRRRLRSGNMAMGWVGGVWSRSSDWRLWSYRARVVWRSSLAQSIISIQSVVARLRSALRNDHNRQRTEARPWRATVQLYFGDIDLSDRWTDVSAEPRPDSLARSLSHLNSMTQDREVLHSILVSLGDIGIGREVAPLVSLDLKSRLTTEIRNNWRQADLVALSRLVLADLHLSDARLIPHSVIARFTRSDRVPSLRSESIVFALVELCHLKAFYIGTIMHYCPDVVVQPRAMRHLLPLLQRPLDLDIIVILAHKHWDHLKDDQSIDLEAELQRRLRPGLKEQYEAQVITHFGGRSGLVEILVFILDHVYEDTITAACALILKIVEVGTGEHPCIVYAFGSGFPQIANAAWAALPPYRPSELPPHLPSVLAPYHLNLEQGLPLGRGLSFLFENTASPPVLDGNPIFELSLARTIIRLLSPSGYFFNSQRPVERISDGVMHISTLEMCIRSLQIQLFSPVGTMSDVHKLEIITALLEGSILIHICSPHLVFPYLPSAHRDVNNILTFISRVLAGLVACRDTYPTGVRLFGLLLSSETTNLEGKPIAWELGAYLREALPRLPMQDPGTEVSMRRFLSALHTLRYRVVLRDDLRAAWDRVQLIVPDDEYTYPFWDVENFDLAESVGLNELAHTSEEAVAPGSTIAHTDYEGCLSLHCLDASMR